MKTVRRPPYPKWNPGYFPCSSLTPLPLSSRPPSVDSGLLIESPALPFQQELPVPSPSPGTLNLLLTRIKGGPGGWTRETLLSTEVPADTIHRRFWDTPPEAPSISLIEIDGREVLSVSPGPDDQVNVIVQLQKSHLWQL